MGSFGNSLENALLDHAFGGSSFTRDATLSLALFTTAPDFEDGSGGTEVAASGYARLSITNNSTNFPAASSGSKSNGAAFSFGTTSAAWGTVVAFGYYAGSTWRGGGTLTTPKVIDAGDPVSFDPGSLTFGLSGCSTYLANKLLDHAFGGPDYTRPATVYAAIFSTYPTSPAAGTGGTELSAGNYSRASITNNSTNFPAASSGSKSNGAEITFPVPNTSWSIDGWGLYDASTTGNFLLGVDISPNKTANSGDTVKFAVGALVITLN